MPLIVTHLKAFLVSLSARQWLLLLFASSLPEGISGSARVTPSSWVLAAVVLALVRRERDARYSRPMPGLPISLRRRLVVETLALVALPSIVHVAASLVAGTTPLAAILLRTCLGASLLAASLLSISAWSACSSMRDTAWYVALLVPFFADRLSPWLGGISPSLLAMLALWPLGLFAYTKTKQVAFVVQRAARNEASGLTLGPSLSSAVEGLKQRVNWEAPSISRRSSVSPQARLMLDLAWGPWRATATWWGLAAIVLAVLLAMGLLSQRNVGGMVADVLWTLWAVVASTLAFPLGIRLPLGPSARRTSSFVRAWSFLPLRAQWVTRALVVHGLLYGALTAACASAVSWLAVSLGTESVFGVRFGLLVLFSVPGVAGFIVCATVGDWWLGAWSVFATVLGGPVAFFLLHAESPTRAAALVAYCAVPALRYLLRPPNLTPNAT